MKYQLKMTKKINSQFVKLNIIEEKLYQEMEKMKILLIPFLPEKLEFKIIQQTDGFCILLDINFPINIPISSLLNCNKILTIEELLEFSI